MKYIALFLVCMMYSVLSRAQIDSAYKPLEFIRTTIETLCAPSMHGRGYQEDGMQKAGDYIAERLEAMKVPPFIAGEYRQRFEVAANSIYKPRIKLDGKTLRPGYDYLIRPNSGSLWASYRLSLRDSIYKHPMVQKDGRTDIRVMADTQSHLLHTEDATIYPERAKIIFDSRLHADLAKAKDIQIRYRNETELHEVFNVSGRIRGVRDSMILFTAHYDHLGMLGSAIFPGASDNASGTALMLALADYFSRQKPYYTLAFIAFASEETGLLGSQYFTDNIDVRKLPIKMVVNLDIMGNAEGGITVVNTEDQAQLLKDFRQINLDKKIGLQEIRKRVNTRNSDHYPFTVQGVPAVFIYSNGGQGYYHDVYDTAENALLTDIEKVFYLLNYYCQRPQY